MALQLHRRSPAASAGRLLFFDRIAQMKHLSSDHHSESVGGCGATAGRNKPLRVPSSSAAAVCQDASVLQSSGPGS